MSKRHQRAAVVEVHADPVPAGGAGIEVGVAPLVVEPGAAGDAGGPALDRERAPHGELRLAVVAARLFRPRPLAREAAFALQDERLGRGERQVVGEAGAVARRVRLVGARARRTAACEAPIAQDERGVGGRGLGDAEAAARDALVVAQASRREVGDGAVREQHLARREAARLRAGDGGGGTEERDLEAPEALAGGERAGHVPPLGARLEMRAEVAREAEQGGRRAVGRCCCRVAVAVAVAGAAFERAAARCDERCQDRAARRHADSIARRCVACSSRGIGATGQRRLKRLVVSTSLAAAAHGVSARRVPETRERGIP